MAAKESGEFWIRVGAEERRVVQLVEWGRRRARSARCAGRHF